MLISIDRGGDVAPGVKALRLLDQPNHFGPVGSAPHLRHIRILAPNPHWATVLPADPAAA